MQNSILFLASSSQSRKKLLELSKIPFKKLFQTADEILPATNIPIEKYVTQIALQKMASVILPECYQQGTTIFVLTADTMCLDYHGHILGKPKTHQEARQMIKNARQKCSAHTAFCIEKKQFINNAWRILEHVVQVVKSEYIIDIPDEQIDFCIDFMKSMDCAGAVTIEEFGMQFVKEIHGSYSNIIGLPLFEVRHALKTLGFQKNGSHDCTKKK
ncbi:Maf family protein [bacterium]|nr:MAG: Maf family protein [bacterium]QQR61653.1 MAG: Maf family protein [bacterium]QQR62781.1 MAG: Maf family protein [bacterium]